MKVFLIALFVLGLLLCASDAIAQSGATGDLEGKALFPVGTEEVVGQPDMIGITARQVVNMFAWLALLILIFFGLVWVLRKVLPSARLAASSSRIVKIMARTQLTAKQAIYVVQVGRSLFVLGVTPESVTNLGRIEDREDIELILEQAGAQEGEGQFRNALAQAETSYTYENTVGRLLNRAKGELDKLMGKVSVWRDTNTQED